MLVYTNFLTLKGKDPNKNEYIPIFYIWFTYLKKYGGLGVDDVLGILTDVRSFNYINNSEYFANISEGCKFRIEFSTYKPPTNLMEGASQKYKCPFPLNEINLYLDIHSLVIRPFSTIFKESSDTLFVTTEGCMGDNNHGGFFLEGCSEANNLPGFSSNCFAFTEGEHVVKFFEDVSKDVLENADSPLYRLDQPFYNYELFLRISGKKEGSRLCIVDSKIISANQSTDNFYGNFNKILSFMCVEFSK